MLYFLNRAKVNAYVEEQVGLDQNTTTEHPTTPLPCRETCVNGTEFICAYEDLEYKRPQPQPSFTSDETREREAEKRFNATTHLTAEFGTTNELHEGALQMISLMQKTTPEKIPHLNGVVRAVRLSDKVLLTEVLIADKLYTLKRTDIKDKTLNQLVALFRDEFLSKIFYMFETPGNLWTVEECMEATSDRIWNEHLRLNDIKTTVQSMLMVLSELHHAGYSLGTNIEMSQGTFDTVYNQEDLKDLLGSIRVAELGKGLETAEADMKNDFLHIAEALNIMSLCLKVDDTDLSVNTCKYKLSGKRFALFRQDHKALKTLRDAMVSASSAGSLVDAYKLVYEVLNNTGATSNLHVE